MLKLKLLGDVRATLEDGQPIQIKPDRVRALLAYLALNPDRPIPRTMLQKLLWSQRSEKMAQANLRKTLYRLRQALGERADDLFVDVPRAVQVNSAEITTDVHQFEMLLSQVKQHKHRALSACHRCIEQLETATGMYSGDLLENVRLSEADQFDDWLIVEQERLHQRVLSGLHMLCEAQLERGSFEAAQRAAAHQIALEPWRESAHGQLMIALAQQGQAQAAFKQFDLCRAILDKELGIAPSTKLRTILSDIHDHKYDPAPSVIVATPHGNLQPAQATFIGRVKERNELIDRLTDPQTRLLTLLGAGGIGKSRLSEEVGLALQPEFSDGVWFISLAGNQSGSVLTAVGDTLGINFHGAANKLRQLTIALRERNMLLILDNFEDVLDDVLSVTELLAATLRLKALCTSREALAVSGEWVMQLDGLDFPPTTLKETGSLLADAATYSGVQLFVERAQQVNYQFALSAENATAIAEICRFVGGSPLGIELAAAWMRHQTPQQLLCRMMHAPDVLQTRRRDVPARQRSMRVVFEQSWQGLTTHQQQILSRLSLFSHGFSVDQATIVAQASLFDLSDLLDKSLLQAHDGQFQIHPLVRHFSAAKQPADPASQRAFSHYFLAWVAQQEAALINASGQMTAIQFSHAYEDVSRAWEIAVDAPDIPSLTAAFPALVYFWEMRGLSDSGTAIVHAALQKLAALPEAAALCQQLQTHLAGMLAQADRYVEAAAMAEAARASGQTDHLSWAQLYHGTALWQLGQHDAGHQLFKEAFSGFKEQRDQIGMVRTLIMLSVVTTSRNQNDLAHQQLERALRLASKARYAIGEAAVLVRLCILTKRQGAANDCRYWGERALMVCEKIGDLKMKASALNVLADLALVEDRVQDADHLLCQARKINEQLDLSLNAVFTNLFLSRLYKQTNRPQAREQALQAALASTHQLGHQWWESQVLAELAKAAADAERQLASVQLAERSLQLARAVNHVEVQEEMVRLLSAEFNLAQPPPEDGGYN